MSDAPAAEPCATLVERGDPERFLVTRVAPPAARARLYPLYALNLELARAPWAASQPIIGEMRLQWWIDTLDRIAGGERPLAHEVAGPLAGVIQSAGLDVAPLKALAEARMRDCWPDPFTDMAALRDYLGQTSGNLMLSAARLLAPLPAGAEAAVAAIGFAQGAAAWLRAAPELAARGRAPFPEAMPEAEAIRALADAGLAALTEGRRGLGRLPGAARPAL